MRHAAEIIRDLFHVVAQCGREFIECVRVNEANRLRGDRAARKGKSRPPAYCYAIVET